MKRTPQYLSLLLALGCSLMLGAQHARAASLYWDANGATDGAGSAPSGTWGLDSFWNTDSTGGAGTFQAATTSSDDLFIVAGPATGSGDGDYTIALNGSTQSANKITFQGAGSLALGDDSKTINLAGGLAVPNVSSYANLAAAIDANLALQGNQSFNITRGALTVNGVISGTANLTVNGNGSKIFTAANTYVGTTTISNAALTLGGSSGSLGTGDVIFTAEHFGSLSFNHTADFIFGNNITGTGNSGAVTKLGNQTLTLTGTNTYSGVTVIRSGAISVNSINTNLGTSGIRLGTSGDTGTLIYTGSGETVTRTMTLQGTTGGGIVQSDGTGALVFTGNFTAGSSGTKTLTLQGGNTDNNEIQGIISQTGKTSVTKSGAGKWVLSGANTYTGSTRVNAGTLALGADERIADTSNLIMAGGTFATNGFSETLGTLTLSTANSIIDLGSGASALTFGDSSAVAWDGSISLSFVNFTQGIDSIRVGTTGGGLTEIQLAQITINGLAAEIDSAGFLTAIPEPSTYAVLLGAVAAGFALVRGRRKV